MKKFILKLLFFLIPFPIYIALVIFIDPFNYVGISNFISQETKENTSEKILPQLWKLIEFERITTSKIILGDSRAGRIHSDNLERIKSISIYNLAYEGASLLDMIETFWIATEIQDLEEVYFSINFNLYNGFERRNRVEQAESIMKNVFTYSFNKIVFWSMIENIKKEFFVKDYKVGVPNMSHAELWEYEINVISKRFYNKYKYPEDYYKKLLSIANYCKQNDIKFTIFIPPTHIELQQRISDFNLEEENKRFLIDISILGEVLNFDIESDFTMNKKNFADPFHTYSDSFLIQRIWP